MRLRHLTLVPALVCAGLVLGGCEEVGRESLNPFAAPDHQLQHVGWSPRQTTEGERIDGLPEP